MEKIYVQYSEILAAIASLQFQLGEKKRMLDEITEELMCSDNEGFGLELSAHAYTNISNRLSSLASESHAIHKDITRLDDSSRSLLWPQNMRAFVIGMVARARVNNNFTIEDSKNTNGGKEYHYEIEVKTWGTTKSMLNFIAIVEGHTIKTGYFNWIDRNRSK